MIVRYFAQKIKINLSQLEYIDFRLSYVDNVPQRKLERLYEFDTFNSVSTLLPIKPDKHFVII